MYAAVKAAAKALKREILALYYAIQDKRTPLLAKVLPWLVGRMQRHATNSSCMHMGVGAGRKVSQLNFGSCLTFCDSTRLIALSPTTFIPWRRAMQVIAYALSPLDLIPDFIPVLGLLDDLILLPALIWLALKLIPKQARNGSPAGL